MVARLLLAAALYQAPPQRALVLVDAGIELSHRGRFSEAGEKFVQALALDPNLAEAHYLLGLVRQQDGRADRAMQSFRAVLKIDPSHAAAQARVCELETVSAMARETGYQAASAACRRAAQLNPKDPEPHFHLGRSQGKLGDRAAAVRELSLALRLDPKFPGVKFELAMAYIDTQDAERAVPLLREVVAAQPNHGNAKFHLASLLVKQDDCAGALPLLETATESSQKYYLMGRCYKRMNREVDAAAAFAKVRELGEGAGPRMQAKLQSSLAQRKAEAGKLEEAIAGYEAALKLAPDPLMEVDLAVLLLQKGEAAKVLELLASNTNPLAHYQMALAHFALGHGEFAVRELEAALRGRPEFVEAWYQMGVTLLSLRRTGEAERALAKATQLRPDEPAIRRAWAEALEKTGKRSAAAEQRRLAGDP
ncbi:MAG TPA: tetratricopeptide repeat protein [Bryobacteraceae bacterium]|nr:tetratricopeptide repeat protein [Bryobacteraceae bacterium]